MNLLISAVHLLQIWCQPLPMHGNLLGESLGDQDEHSPIVLLNSVYLIQCLLDVVWNPFVDILHNLLRLVLFLASHANAL